MAKSKGNPENLIPNSERTPEQIKEMTRNGGIKSGKVRREKKLMSQIYAAFLESEFDIVIDDEERKVTGESLVEHAMRKVLAKSDSSSVSLMKEIRESTEGNKLALSGSVDNLAALSREEREAYYLELRKKADEA